MVAYLTDDGSPRYWGTWTLHPGDVLLGPPLPVNQRDDVRYRVLLRCETLTPHRTEAE